MCRPVFSVVLLRPLFSEGPESETGWKRLVLVGQSPYCGVYEVVMVPVLSWLGIATSNWDEGYSSISGSGCMWLILLAEMPEFPGVQPKGNEVPTWNASKITVLEAGPGNLGILAVQNGQMYKIYVFIVLT
ncbi:hypothetical protein B0H13DRAFT_1858890 [Mycena leptocephala]|nr:hypothetical protein B0H13DRAFT_1858890 [Mycena leptocephala]